MTDGGVLGEACVGARGLSVAGTTLGGASAWAVRASRRLDDVALAWHALEADGVESPGQSWEFTSLWTQTQQIPGADQNYVVASVAGAPIALLPLCRRRVAGVAVLSWFPGAHVGCNAPLVDGRRLAQLTSSERRMLWQQMVAATDADLLHLPSVPVCEVDGVDICAELGETIAGDTLYRAAFSSWEEANATQRNKSRRKHDRQQGERLEALGAVTFEELGPGPKAAAILQQMFWQRAVRFRQCGIPDPFTAEVRRFYEATVALGSGIEARLHVLRLDSAVVAVRYNIVHGHRMFCLISSMSEDVTIQSGSPGKQCLLRVMQRVFENGITIFDMGAGFTDEKRHWCNLQVPLRHHYLPLTRKGVAAAQLHRSWQMQRQRIKSHPTLLRLAKSLRSKTSGVSLGR